MNKNQAWTILVATINLLLMLLFPPYDYLSVHHNVPSFDGFLFLFGDHPDREINNSFLAAEVFTVLVNAAIAWLLLRDATRLRRRLDRQNLVLLGVALNLLLVLLFPPFQDYYTGSKALLPSFDGFYFVFGDNSERVLITPMLWVEVVFVLVNAAMLWLLLRRPAPAQMSEAERYAQAEASLATRRRRKA